MKKTTPSNILNRGSESPSAEHTIALRLQSFSRRFRDVLGRKYNYPFFSNLMSHSEAGDINTTPSRRAVGLWASVPAGPHEVNIGFCRFGLSTSCSTLQRHCLGDPGLAKQDSGVTTKLLKIQRCANSLLSPPAPPQTVPQPLVSMQGGETPESIQM